MVAILIYVVDTIRRALDKFGRGLSIIVESYREAQNFRRRMPRLHIDD